MYLKNNKNFLKSSGSATGNYFVCMWFVKKEKKNTLGSEKEKAGKEAGEILTFDGLKHNLLPYT